jgi:predicted helicase
MPRIPFVKEFSAISEAGKALGLLHSNHMSCDEYPLVVTIPADVKLDEISVTKMRWDSKSDKPSLIINNSVSLSGFPLDYQDFTVNGRSPIDWAIDRYQVKTEPASGILNDPNNELHSLGGAISTIQRLAFVSSESIRIMASMPALKVID